MGHSTPGLSTQHHNFDLVCCQARAGVLWVEQGVQVILKIKWFVKSTDLRIDLWKFLSEQSEVPHSARGSQGLSETQRAWAARCGNQIQLKGRPPHFGKQSISAQEFIQMSDCSSIIPFNCLCWFIWKGRLSLTKFFEIGRSRVEFNRAIAYIIYCMDTYLSICLILNAQKFWTLDRIGNSRTRTLYLIWINFVGKWLRWGLLQNRIPVLIVLMGLWDSNKQNKMINFKSSRNKTVPLIWLLVWQFFPCMFCLFWAIFIFLYKNLSLLLLSLSDSLGRPAYTFLLVTWFIQLMSSANLRRRVYRPSKGKIHYHT